MLYSVACSFTICGLVFLACQRLGLSDVWSAGIAATAFVNFWKMLGLMMR